MGTIFLLSQLVDTSDFHVIHIDALFRGGWQPCKTKKYQEISLWSRVVLWYHLPMLHPAPFGQMAQMAREQTRDNVLKEFVQGDLATERSWRSTESLYSLRF